MVIVSKLMGDVKSGELLRLPFLGYSVVIGLIMLAFGLIVVFSMGAGEHLLGGDIMQAQDKLRGWFGIPAMIITMMVCLALLFAGFNISAKRIRNMGLPGWWGVLAVTVAGFVLSALISEQGGSIFNGIYVLCLLFIPANTFAKGT